MHRIENQIRLSIKTTAVPSLRVSPAFRKKVEEVLEQGKTLPGFARDAVIRRIEVDFAAMILLAPRYWRIKSVR